MKETIKRILGFFFFNVVTSFGWVICFSSKQIPNSKNTKPNRRDQQRFSGNFFKEEKSYDESEESKASVYHVNTTGEFKL